MNLSTPQGRLDAIEPLGPKIRRQRRRLGLTLDELAASAGISKPYLSVIETGRVANPPSDEKLRRLEQTLGFTTGELLTQAHLQRTPKDVRAVLHQLMGEEGSFGEGTKGRRDEGTEGNGEEGTKGRRDEGTKRNGMEGTKGQRDEGTKGETLPSAPFVPSSLRPSVPITRDPSSRDTYLSGVLHEMTHRSTLQCMTANVVPVINRVSAGYPRDFRDLSYPQRAADEYLSCPDVTDRDAFAVRVDGDSMTPKYRPGDIVVFSPALAAGDGDDCFIRFTDGQTTFKRVFFESGENSQSVLRLQPRNERHRAQVVPSEKVAGLHKAVYLYQRVDSEIRMAKSE